ncbi:MAG: hypothetical protein JWM96_101 [Alphaproteobacteria bacterium]|nr:hypothetical protein [Alphaproteobacteria bacterium]
MQDKERLFLPRFLAPFFHPLWDPVRLGMTGRNLSFNQRPNLRKYLLDILPRRRFVQCLDAPFA